MRLMIATAALLIGGAATGAAYWGFLNTPESSVPALLLSAMLLLVTLTLLSATVNAAIVAWSSGWSAAHVRRAAPRVWSIVPAAIVVLLFWWMAGRIDTWVALRSGEINAWFIARFGWDDVTWLYTGVRWLTAWLRWVIAALLAVSLMAGIAGAGWRGMLMPAWIRRGVRPRALAAGTVWFVALIVLPWVYLVPWRPQWLPPTSGEMAFIVIKLSIAAILIAVGVALLIHEAVRVPVPPTDPRLHQAVA